MAEPSTIDRHRMLRVDPLAWRAMLAGRPDIAALPLAASWAERHWPLVVRRRMCADGPGMVPLGLPLPPGAGKLRLALAMPENAILANEAPPLLADAAQSAPAAWHATLAALGMQDRHVRCFGSLAWEWLTGLSYLSATSDLDLIWPVANAVDADDIVCRIARAAHDAPMRIDGELHTPAGLALQWREWSAGSAEVVVKTIDNCVLLARGKLFG